jgi:hypothetical protein
MRTRKLAAFGLLHTVPTRIVGASGFLMALNVARPPLAVTYIVPSRQP